MCAIFQSDGNFKKIVITKCPIILKIPYVSGSQPFLARGTLKSKKNLAAHLEGAQGTLVYRGTPVEKPYVLAYKSRNFGQDLSKILMKLK